MRINRRLKFFAIALCVQMCSCNDKLLGLDCANSQYSFELNVIAYPAKDSITSFDTLWVEVNSPVEFLDRGTGSIVDYSRAENLGSAIGFQKLERSSFTINAVDKFEYTLKKGSEVNSVNPDLFKEFLFVEENHRYVFLLGIIPKENGIFRLVFSNAGNVYRSNDKCTKAGFEINFKDTEQHFYFDPNYVPGNPTSGGGVYYFKVIS